MLFRSEINGVEREGENKSKMRGKTNWDETESNQYKTAVEMKCVDQNEPSGRVQKIFNPLGRMEKRPSASIQRATPYSVPDIRPEPQVGPSDSPQVGWLFPLRPTSVSCDSKRHVLVTQIRIQRRKRRRKILWHGSQGSPNASKTPRKRENNTWKLIQSY